MTELLVLAACMALASVTFGGLVVYEFFVALYDYLASTSDPEEET